MRSLFTGQVTLIRRQPIRIKELVNNGLKDLYGDTNKLTNAVVAEFMFYGTAVTITQNWVPLDVYSTPPQVQVGTNMDDSHTVQGIIFDATGGNLANFDIGNHVIMADPGGVLNIVVNGD
jgi:hypothetical protein